jgi:hypothetical protein
VSGKLRIIYFKGKKTLLGRDAFRVLVGKNTK